MIAFVVALLLAFHRDEHGWSPLPDFKGIANAIGGFLSDIRDFFSGLVSFFEVSLVNFYNAFLDFATHVGDLVKWFGTVFTNAVIDFATHIGDLVKWFGTVFTNAVVDFASHVSDLAKWFGQLAVNALTDLGAHAGDLAKWFGQLLVNAVAATGGGLVDAVKWSGQLFVNAVSSTGDALGGSAKWFGTQLVNAITGTGDKIVDMVKWFGTTVANSATDVKDAVEAAPDKIGPAVSEALVAAWNNEIRGLSLAERGTFKVLFEVLDGIIKAARNTDSSELEQYILAEFNRGIEALVGKGTIAPVDARRALSDALIAATEYGLVAQLFSAVSSLIPVENATPLSYLANFMGRFSSYDPLIDVAVKNAVDISLGRPYRHLVEYNTRTQLPVAMALEQLVGRRKINTDQFAFFHQQHGYNDEWTGRLLDASYRPARVFELARIMAQTDIDDATLQSVLEDAGYRDSFIGPLKLALHATAKKTSSSKLLASATSAYSDGFIDDADFGAMCAAAGVAPDEQRLLLFVAQVDYQVKVKGELLSAYRARATADALTDEELRAGLAGIGVTGAKADVEVARAHIARLKKPVDDTAAAHRKAVNETRATLTTAYKLQFKKGAISEQQLQDQLVYIGIPDFQARAIVELTKAEMLKTPAPARGSTPAEVAARVQRDLEDAYITQFAHDAIDAGQLGAQLLSIGIDQAEAIAIVAREQAKKIPRPTGVKKMTPEMVAKQVNDTLGKAYEEQFLKGKIGADELEQDLVAVGMDPDVAHARRLLDEAKAAKKTPPTSTP